MSEDIWLTKVQETVRGVEFFYPQDDRNPMPGLYTVVGPTSEVAQSQVSIEHAAMIFLSTFRGDVDARAAATQVTRLSEIDV